MNISKNYQRFALLLSFKLQQCTDSETNVNLKMKKETRESFCFYSCIGVSFRLQLIADEFLVYVTTYSTQVFHPFLKKEFHFMSVVSKNTSIE